MKYVTRMMSWGVAGTLLLLGASITTHLPLSAATRAASDFVFPHYRFYSGDSYNLATERTLITIFNDRLRPAGQYDAKKIARHLHELCKKHRLDPAFVLSLIQAESGFRPEVVSYAGAIGLMQVMPATAAYVARKYKIPYRGKNTLKDPIVNLTLGVTYLKELQNRYRGKSGYFALAAYNMGPARLDELAARPNFKPTKTLKYYESIMRGVDTFRYYGAKNTGSATAEVQNRKIPRSVPKPARPSDPPPTWMLDVSRV